MSKKCYVLISKQCGHNIEAISTDMSKLEIVKDAMIKRLDGVDRWGLSIEGYDDGNDMCEYAKNMPVQPLWRVLIFASGNCRVLGMDFVEEYQHVKENKGDIRTTRNSKGKNFEVFVRADDRDQAETIAREKLSQYKSKSEDVTSSETKEDIVERGMYKLEFSIDYIQSKKFEASFVVNMKDNLKFIKIDRYILYDYDDKFITDDHNPLLINIKFNPRKDKMVISVVLYIQEAIPKEKLIEITKPFVCEEIFRRFIKP